MTYQDRLAEVEALLERARRQSAQALGILLAAGAVLLLLAWAAVVRHAVPLWYPPLALPVALIAYLRYGRESAATARAVRLYRHYVQGVERLAGRWAGQGVTGEEFRWKDHVYAADLNLFGRASLFERLSTARTEIGRERLAGYLQQPVSLDEARARQDAVRELRDNTLLREEVALLGRYAFLESNWQTFRDWLDSPPESFPRWIRIPALLTAAWLGLLLLAGFDGIIPVRQMVRWGAPVLLAHGFVGLLLREKTNRVVAGVRRVGVEIGLVREGLELLRRQSFQSPLLQSLMQTPESVRALRRLERYLRLLEERNKDFFYMPGLLLLAGTQCAMAIEAWRRLHGKDLEHWLSAWAEFEALNALGCYAHERPEDSFPVFEDAAVFDAVALGHPLLPGRACVRNDVRLDARRRFLLISGSNMAGKSTLLRSIGISAVLAYCGAPVAAGRLRLSVFSLAASISAVDSLEDGKSRFLVEVERLRRAIELAESRPPLLFLIDEIFSGTSSLDRRAAAEAVMRRLVGSGAVGAMTTHDLTLTAIAGLPGLHGENVHMGCREGAAHPLDFDYRLKRGVTTERNALAIARMAGVVD